MTKIKAFGYLLFAAVLTSSVTWSVPGHAAGYSWLGGSDDEDDAKKSSSDSSLPGGIGGRPQAKDDSASTDQSAPALPNTPSATAGKDQVIHDLGMASAVYAPREGVKAPAVDFSNVKHQLINGKPAMLFLVEQRIQQAKNLVTNKKMPAKDRDAKIKEVYKNLLMLAKGLRSRQQTPDSVYKSMKLSDTYIREQRESDTVAIKELDAALAALKTYQ